MHGLLDQSFAWLRIARLHFYPPVAVLYGLGAVAARVLTGRFDRTLCALGYAYLFLVGLATSMSNDYFDHPSDAVNANAGPFTGGSRVLVDGRLGFGAVRAGILFTGAAALFVSAALAVSAPAEHRPAIVVLLALGMILALGYTLPPLKLSYRGLGELDVAFMHSIFVKFIRSGAPEGRIDPLLVNVLAFTLWFGVVSLLHFLRL